MTIFSLESALKNVIDILRNFTLDANFRAEISVIFGKEKASLMSPEGLLSALNTLPDIKILTSEELKGGLGAFSSETGKIYLSETIFKDKTLLTRTLLEEIGHYLDDYFGGIDAKGDEGELFASLVLGESLDHAQLTRLKQENDHGKIIVDGEVIAVEMANHIRGDDGRNNLTGTNEDDLIEGFASSDILNGLDGNDTLDGGTGSNIINGGDGDDTIIPARGTSVGGKSIVYGGEGNDLLIVDFTEGNTGGLFNYSLGINTIRENKLTVSYFSIERLNLTGTPYQDILTGFDDNDTLQGGAGNDSINGKAGDDVLIGVDPTQPNPVVNEIDILTGGFGADLFILGDESQAFYNDGNSGSDGTSDYARITDFYVAEGDRLQVYGDLLTDYTFMSISAPGTDSCTSPTLPSYENIDDLTGIAMFLHNPESETEELELIAVFEGITDIGRIIPSDPQGQWLERIPNEDTIIGGEGNDPMMGGDSLEMTNHIRGDNDRNNLTGTNEDDLIEGFGGNDTLNGLDGDDTLDGGTGSNTINGGDGDDTIIPARGSRINGSVDGGEGNDLLIADFTEAIHNNIFPARGPGIGHHGLGIFNYSLGIKSISDNGKLHLSYYNIERLNLSRSQTRLGLLRNGGFSRRGAFLKSLTT